MTTLRRKKPANEIRCAIYTRKSSEEGLDQDFNSLDAQREAGELYIASQKNEGWIALSNQYNDGGFTGGNMDRPALTRLLKDIEDGHVDCVVVYKVDRLSRSLLDFSRIMEVFENAGVSFVSVTQQFNTTHSMGRLTLNILLSFAQFEREIISERTRDKIAAQRRKGKWSGGQPPLGYDVERLPGGPRIVPNEFEANQVRKIFESYLAEGSLLPVVKRINKLGWVTKRRVSKKGTARGGKPFDRHTVHRILTNVTYIGKLAYRDEIHEGEHVAIVATDVWHEVQERLKDNANGKVTMRNQHNALLKGLVRCANCGSGMGHTFTSKGNKRYRYYVCTNAQKRGRDECPSKSVPAQAIEDYVLEQIRTIGKDPSIVTETFAKATADAQASIESLQQERRGIVRKLKKAQDEIGKLVANETDGEIARLADLNDRVREYTQRMEQIDADVDRLEAGQIDERDVAEALGRFDPVWNELTTNERARLFELLIKCVEYDGAEGTVEIAFHPTGIAALNEQFTTEAAA